MSNQYAWALNAQKLARAVGKKGSSATEAEIKEEYVRIGGKVALSELKEIKMDEKEELVDEIPSVVDEQAKEEPKIESEVSSTPEVDLAPEETITSTDDVA